MNRANTPLANERNLARHAAPVALTCALTGFATYAVDIHSSWLQWSVLAHVLTGIAFTLVAVPYLYLHFRRTVSVRRISVLGSGLFSILPVLTLVVSGLHMLFVGQQEAARWVYTAHVVAGMVLVAAIPLHVVLHSTRGARKRTGSEGEFPGVPQGTVRGTLVFGIAAQVLIVALALAYELVGEPYSIAPAAGEYEYSYGPHRFRPSQTETSNGAFIDKRQVAESRKCISCHRDVAEQWYASVHRQAASDIAYVKNVNLLANKKGISATRYCEGCHAPVALLSGELSPGGQHGGIVGSVGNVEGVSCMGCHGIESLVHLKGVASFNFKPREDYLFARSENPVLGGLHDLLIRLRPDQHRADLGKPLFGDPKFCAGCHTQFMDEDFNNWGWVKMQDDYAAWLKSPYSKQHEESFANTAASRCQDCHMPLVPSSDPSADASGSVRSHRFLGANTFLPVLNGDHEHLAMLKSFLQSSKLRISIEHPNRADSLQTLQPLAEELRDFAEAPYYYYLGETAKLRVAVSNRGVGHDFPGGTIDINEAWIEIRVLDAEGAEVHASGLIDANNAVDPEAHFYRSLPVDRKGDLVWRHDLFNMIGESFRRVIKAGETDVTEYSFEVPAWAKSPLTATATLKYRKLNDRYARWALGEKYIQIPAIDMTWDSLELPIKLRKEVNAM